MLRQLRDRYLNQILKWTKGMFKLVNIEEKENRNIFLCLEKQ